MRFGFFDSDGLKLRYFEAGNGRPLILVHGLGGSLEAWSEQYDELSRRFNVVALDLRGFGMSDVPESVSIGDFARDVSNLMEHLGIQKASILGHSMGGLVCMEFYARYPEKVESLILANTFHRLPESMREEFEKRLEILESSPDMSQIAAFISQISLYQNRPEHRELVETIIRKNDKRIYTLATAEIFRADYEDLLPRIEVPVLVIVAEHDATTPPAFGEAIHRLVPNSVLKRVSSSAHLSMLENPEEFNRAVVEFLEGLQQ
ncbi:putative hydrolases or acyltransferases {alpha/beta hydrolase superfamily} [Geoglobus ahangari]|uniref:Putative hydrolases or acyltransferases (alpha/beta hydrolase superfamily) n=1 Tax=Geoglobus ahangari TaxID=113653 RepID=A0A0F7IIR1_9EURY|nr:alpha/beta hydrolase [Geoglobus ahangari]AKG92007.1 putative hydrolases or acyltransferases {alpha/beta hydrolase superfamily} [Geoglobus ahangari]